MNRPKPKPEHGHVIPPPTYLEVALKELCDEAEKNMIFVPVEMAGELDRTLKQARVSLHRAEQKRLPFS